MHFLKFLNDLFLANRFFISTIYSLIFFLQLRTKLQLSVPMDLSKAFDCSPHDLLLARPLAYGLDAISLKHILCYLSGRKQCMKTSNTIEFLDT